MQPHNLIRQRRADLSDYLIHWTTSLDVLKQILQCGYLKAGLGRRGIRSKPTIHGEKAVCFTEQTLREFSISCTTLPERYHPYGVAVRRVHLYNYGGRPVFYCDKKEFGDIPDHLKYRVVLFNPNEEIIHYNNPFPNDWTHEREWRSKVYTYPHWRASYLYPAEGVPILLPYDYTSGNDDTTPALKIIVCTQVEREELMAWRRNLHYVNIMAKNPRIGTYLLTYFRRMLRADIITLDEVNRNSSDSRWGKIETLPE